jgi:Pentapeptide repeats (8 copies)
MPQDFSGQNLRGRSFKGKNLEGANFSYADIRGADFTDALLQDADFRSSKAGLKKIWVILQLVVVLMLLAITLLTFTPAALLVILSSISSQNPASKYSWIPYIMSWAIFIGILVSIIRQGFTVETFSAIAVLISVVLGIGLIADILFAISRSRIT